MPTKEATTRETQTYRVTLYHAASPWCGSPDKEPYHFEVMGRYTGKGGHGYFLAIDSVYVDRRLPVEGEHETRMKYIKPILRLVEEGVNTQLVGKAVSGMFFTKLAEPELGEVRI